MSATQAILTGYLIGAVVMLSYFLGRLTVEVVRNAWHMRTCQNKFLAASGEYWCLCPDRVSWIGTPPARFTTKG